MDTSRLTGGRTSLDVTQRECCGTVAIEYWQEGDPEVVEKMLLPRVLVAQLCQMLGDSIEVPVEWGVPEDRSAARSW